MTLNEPPLLEWDAGRNTALDPAVAALIRELSIRTPKGELTAAARRKLATETFAAMHGDTGSHLNVRISEEVVFREDGGSIRLRVYHPRGARIDAPAQVLYVHGGGWVTGTIESYDLDVSRFVRQTGLIVASVDYRLAPEHQFPLGLNDCLVAARWLASRAVGRTISLAGDSAGGNLALECALLLKGTISLDAILLLYPVLDPEGRQNASYEKNGEGYQLTGADMDFFWRSYLGDTTTIAALVAGDR